MKEVEVHKEETDLGTRQDPPSIDDLIKNFQKTINKFSGGSPVDQDQ